MAECGSSKVESVGSYSRALAGKGGIKGKHRREMGMMQWPLLMGDFLVETTI